MELKRRVLIVIALIALAADIGGQAPARAAATPGAFVWHDLVTDNPASARSFYGRLLGWTFEPGEGVDPGYTIISYRGRWIGGIVQRRDHSAGPGGAQWLSYVMVSDIDRAVRQVRDAGGRVLRGPLNVRKDLRVVAVEDPQGAPLGLASRGPHVEGGEAGGLHDWFWMEYVARDPDSALAFYAGTLGFAHEVSDRREHFTYYLLSRDGPRAGLFRSVFERATSAWLPYIRIEDPLAMAARVSELGGVVLVPPQPRVRNGSLTIALDPAGAVFALQKYPFDRGATP